MPEVDSPTNQATLDSLRNVRRTLYSIPESELSAMSLEDQEAYAADLHEIGLAILKLEAAKLKGVNDAFKSEEIQLNKAAAALESDLAALTDAVRIVRVASEGLTLVSNVVKLLA